MPLTRGYTPDTAVLYLSTGGQTGGTAATTGAEVGAAMRSVVDLNTGVTQMRLVVTPSTLAVGGTTYTVRAQWSTAAQTTWADMQATGTGVSLMGASPAANAARESGWVDIVPGAKIAACYIRAAFVSTGTATTAPVVKSVYLYFR